MKSIINTVLAIISLVAGTAFAAPAQVTGEELKNLVVTEKGTTWTLSNKEATRITFMPDGTMLACDNGLDDCDYGTYTLTENSINTKMESWFSKSNGERKIELKKDEGNFFINGLSVSRSEVATLVPPKFRWKLSLPVEVFGGQIGDLYTGTPSVALRRHMNGLATQEAFSPEKISARTAASRAIMALGMVRILYTSKTVAVPEAGMENQAATSTQFEISPKSFEFTPFRVASHCVRGTVKAVYAIDSYGLLIMQPVLRVSDCVRFQYVFDPLTSQGFIVGSEGQYLTLREGKLEILK